MAPSPAARAFDHAGIGQTGIDAGFLQAGGQQGRQQRGRVADAAGQRVVRRVRHRHQARRPQGLADAVGRRDELGLEVGEARLIGRVDLVQRPRRRLAGVRPDPYRRAAVR